MIGFQGNGEDWFSCLVSGLEYGWSSDRAEHRNSAMERIPVERGTVDRRLVPIYNPAVARQCPAFFASTVPVRDIGKGEEIRENLLRRPASSDSVVSNE